MNKISTILLVAGIAYPIAIGIRLLWIGYARTVIITIENAVHVIIGTGI